MPKGLDLTGTDYPVWRRCPRPAGTGRSTEASRGSPILPGGDLVLAVQSPLALPDTSAGKTSRITRLLRFSPRGNTVTAEYAYRFDPVNVVDPSEGDPTELKISSVVAVGR